MPSMNSSNDYSSTPVATALDRRHYPRHTVQVQIEIHPEGTDVPMRFETTDISRGGCYVQMMMPFNVGCSVRITLWLDGHAIVIRGKVVTHHPQFGNGITFVDFEGEGDRLLKQYLEEVVTEDSNDQDNDQYYGS
jgi:c-di-GMP-binding flagellar brake protein YcgR